MTDIETVANGLNNIGGFIAGRVGFEQARNFLRTIDDAIDLLKEQEAVEPKITPWKTDDNGDVIVAKRECGNCGWMFFTEKPNYCENCGRSVKWNECNNLEMDYCL